MNRKKKLSGRIGQVLSLLLALVLAIGLTACGAGHGSGGESESSSEGGGASAGTAAAESGAASAGDGAGKDAGQNAGSDSAGGEKIPAPDDQGGKIKNFLEAGISMPVPESYGKYTDKVYIEMSGGEYLEGSTAAVVNLYTLPEEQMRTAEEGDYQAFSLLWVFAISDGLGLEGFKKEYQEHFGQAIPEENTFTQICTGAGYTLYKVEGIQGADPESLDSEMKSIVEELQADTAESISRMTLFTPVSGASGGSAAAFETTDLNGSPVNTLDLFKAHKYTMINVWASWCGPCVRELPELETLRAELEAQDCGIIGILIDGNTGSGLADGKDILADTGVTYVNLIPTDEITAFFRASSVPTTYFADSTGTIVGEPIVGADPDGYRARIKELLGGE